MKTLKTHSFFMDLHSCDARKGPTLPLEAVLPQPPKQPKRIPLKKQKPLVNAYEFKGKQKELFELLDAFFTEEHLKDVIVPIQNHERPICLRTLEHLVTSYASTHQVEYRRNERDITPWNVYESYHDQLKYGGNKKKLDTFRRGPKFAFKKGETEIITTLCQLNFFRWAIQNKVIDWAMEHAEAIRVDMAKVDALKEKDKQDKQQQQKRKRALTLRSSPILLNVKIQVQLV